MPSASISSIEEWAKRQKVKEDRISTMPDDVLISILSLLTMKTAAGTSVLSRRWRYLWTFTCNLNFCGLEVQSRKVQQARYVNWVNQIIASHKAQALDEFSINYPLKERNYKCDIDKWFEFALARRPKRLTIDLDHLNGRSDIGSYTLTTQFLRRYCLDSLTIIRFSCVEMTDDVFEHILSSCPLLVALSMSTFDSLLHVKVSGPSLRLNYLEMSKCWNVKSIEISARSLISFRYRGAKVEISLKEAPCLAEVSLEGRDTRRVLRNLVKHSSSLSQLETLTLDFNFRIQWNYLGILRKFDRVPKIPLLGNLKQLVLIFKITDVASLLNSLSLLKKAPMLQRLVLMFFWLKEDTVKLKPKVPKAEHPYKCLEVVELIGFLVNGMDIELADAVVTNSLALKKLITDPRNPNTMYRWNPDKMSAARNCARKLEKRLPQGVELVIL